MHEPRRRPRQRWVALVLALVAAGAVAQALGNVLVVLWLPNDAVGYVSVARNWVEGRGFVDPILYSYHLDGATAPVAAIVVRPPVISALAALPLRLGADLADLYLLHAIWASAIGASLLLLALRHLSLPGATAAAIALAWSPAWTFVSRAPLTDATAIGVLLLLLATAPRALRSVPGALGLAVLTLLGWLTRPNLAAFAPLCALAFAIDRGPRAALRCGPLWAYLLGSAALLGSVAVAVRWATGFAPYAHYGFVVQTLEWSEVSRYRTGYPGSFDFARRHAAELLAILWNNLSLTLQLAFTRPYYLYVGWIGAPGIAICLLRSGRGSFERRLLAIVALGFTLVALATSWAFDALRYPLPAVVCAWIAGMVFVEEGLRRLSRGHEWRPGSGARRAVAALPLLLVAAPVALDVLPRSAKQWERFAAWGEYPPVPGVQEGERWFAATRAFCGPMQPDALVSSPSPWVVLYWCGNAGYLIPPDLDSPEWLDRYLDEMTPGYVIEDRAEALALFESSPRLKHLATHGAAKLFRVRDAPPGSHPWRSPGPLHALTKRP